MKQFNWNPEKNEKLKKECGVSFIEKVCMKKKYKLEYILKCQNFTSLGKFHGSWFHSLFSLKSWFHMHFGIDWKMQTSNEETINTIMFMVKRGVKTI